MHRHVLLSLAYTSSNWDTDTGGEFTEEKVYNVVKHVYDNMPGKELHTLVPKFGVWFQEINSGTTIMERKKMLTLFFNAKWALEVKFVIEKKRNNKNLVDLAAEAVVRNIVIEEEIVELPIPETLFPIVRNKFCDIEWVRSYWNSQTTPPPPQQQQQQQQHESPNTPAELNNIPHDDVPNDPPEEDVDEEEEFLSAVIDEISDDVQHIIDQHMEPTDNDSGQNKLTSPNGIDGLLIVWVVLFLILAVIVYSCC